MNRARSTTVAAIITSIILIFLFMLLLSATGAVRFELVPQQFWNYKSDFLRFTLVTLRVAVIATFLGVLLGFVLAIIKNLEVTPRDSIRREYAKRTSKMLVDIYVDVIRGTPMLVQALIFSSVIFILFGIQGEAVAIIIVFVNTAAYATEVIRSGINGVDKGELEAARSLGMTHFQAMRHVILPQAFRNVVPAIGNELIVNVKDTSILSVIGITELTFYSRQVSAATFIYTETYMVTAAIYLICTKTLTLILQLIVNKLDDSGNKTHLSMPTSQTTPEVIN